MMRFKTYTFISICITWIFVSGCASNTLKISVDLYKEDPRQLELETEDIINIRQGLSDARVSSKSLAEQRKSIATDQSTIYKSLLELNLGPDPSDELQVEHDEDIETVNDRLDEYINWVDGHLADLNTAISDAEISLEKYLLFRNPDETVVPSDDQSVAEAEAELKWSVLLVSQKYFDLAGPAGGEFEKSITSRWISVINALDATVKGQELSAEQRNAVNTIRLEARGLANTMKEVAEEGNRQASEAQQALSQAMEGVDFSDTSALRESVKQIGMAVSEVPELVGLGQGGRDALINLAAGRAIFESQIDRLQDPGDPVWRIVSDKENEDKWNNVFVETYFYAEGNSSVVVVRDSPISYRTQRGQNNPTALVRGQLQVSRAIADAAVTIAGSAVGVTLDQTDNDNEKTEGDESSQTLRNGSMAKAEELATRRAKAEQEEVLRLKASRNLRRDLRRYIELIRLSVPGSKDFNQAAFDADLDSLKALLEGHRLLFQVSAE